MTSSVLHLRFIGSSSCGHTPLYCLYDPSNTYAMFDGVSIHSPLGSFPLPLSENSSMNDTHLIIVDLSLIQFDVPPIDIPSTKTSSTLLLDLMHSP